MTIVTLIKGFFTDLLYPLIIIFILYYIFNTINSMIKATPNLNSGARRLATAILPAIFLAFVLILESEYSIQQMKAFLFSLTWGFQFVVGLILGIEFVQIKKYFGNACDDKLVIPAILFTSSFSIFILYAVIRQMLPEIRIILFGMIIAGVMLAMVFGLKDPKRPNWAKPVLLAIFIVNLTIVLAGMFIPGLATHDLAAEIEAEKQLIAGVRASGNLTYLEKEYINLLEDSISHKDIDNDSNSDIDIDKAKFDRAMQQFYKMKSHKNIPEDLLLNILEIAYPKGNAGIPKYVDISLEIIAHLKNEKITESCELLARIHAQGGELDQKTEEAMEVICGYARPKDKKQSPKDPGHSPQQGQQKTTTQ